MEFVYVVNKEDFYKELPQGYVFVPPKNSHNQISFFNNHLKTITEKGYFVEREHAEQDQRLKQIIPYVLIFNNDKIFMIQRSRAGGENRLYDKCSIGIGGHINPQDICPDRYKFMINCINREFNEELDFNSSYSLKLIGMVNDDSNSVGSVHLGVVFKAKFKDPNIRSLDFKEMSGEYFDIEELKKLNQEHNQNFETWTSLILQNL